MQTTLQSCVTNCFVSRQDSRNSSYITSVTNTLFYIFSIQTHKRFKRTLIYYDLDLHSANFRGSPLRQTSSHSCLHLFIFYIIFYYIISTPFSSPSRYPSHSLHLLVAVVVVVVKAAAAVVAVLVSQQMNNVA